MVHTGLMENAVDQSFDNRPDNDNRASDGKTQTMDGGQSQAQDGFSQ